MCSSRSNLGFGYIELGCYDRAEAELRATLALAERLGLRVLRASALHNLGIALARAGRLDEGLAQERAALEDFEGQADRNLIGYCRCYLAEIHWLRGELDAAADEAARAAELLEGVSSQALALATAALVELARGRVAEADARARRGAEIAQRLGLDEGDARLSLAVAETRAAVGDPAAAAVAIAEGCTRVLGRADLIRSDELRARFLAIADHARLLSYR